jgi:hypothetical protein
VLSMLMSSTGINLRNGLIVLAALALASFKRVPIFLILLLAGLAGVVLYGGS